MEKNHKTLGFEVDCVNWISLARGTALIASDGLDWTGLEARFHSWILDLLLAIANI
jgi:hypothetical protein